MEKHKITIDTENRILLLDGKPLECCEKVAVTATPTRTEVTVTMCCDVKMVDQPVDQLIKDDM